MRARHILVASCLLLLAAPALAGPDAEPQVVSDPASPLAAPSSTVQQYVPNQAMTSQGAHPGGRGRSGSVVAIPTKEVKVQIFQTPDGKTGWKAKIPGHRALATPAVVDGMVFVGGGFGSHEFYAFDAETGKPAWAIRLSDDGPTAAVVAGGKVVFNTESCTLFVVDAKTGKQVWSRWLGDPLMSQPAVSDGIVYMAYPGPDGEHRLIALTLDAGKQRFEVRIAGDIMTAPVVEGDSVYLTTLDGTVYRHRTADGVLVWKKAMQATSAPWIQDGEVHVAQRDSADGAAQPTEGLRVMTKEGENKGELRSKKGAAHLSPEVQDRSGYAAKQAADDSSVGFGGGAPAAAKTGAAKLNIGRGTVSGLWEYQGSRPMKVGKKSYATQGDVMRGIDADTGKVLWEKKLAGDLGKVGGHLGSPPAFADNKLVLGTAAGQIKGFDAESGTELFSYDLKEEIRFQPALARGRIFVGTQTGTLVSIQSGNPALDGWTMWGGGPEHNGPRALPTQAVHEQPAPEKAAVAAPEKESAATPEKKAH
jgi:Ca-activated chloride channel family protein